MHPILEIFGGRNTCILPEMDKSVHPVENCQKPLDKEKLSLCECYKLWIPDLSKSPQAWREPLEGENLSDVLSTSQAATTH